MGADMLAMVIIRHKDTPVAKPDDPAVVAALHAAAHAWVDAISAYPHGVSILDEAMWDDDLGNEDVRTRAQSMVGEVVAAMKDITARMHSREWACWPTGDYLMWITGGMSWGDAPTEAFSELSRLNEIDVNSILWDAATGNDSTVTLTPTPTRHHVGPVDNAPAPAQ